MMSGIEKLKLWMVAGMVVAAIYIGGYAPLSPGVRFATVVGVLAVAAGLVGFSRSGRDFYRFAREAGVELRKVVWPNKQETAQLTGIVFVFLSIATLFLWLADLIIGYLLGLLIA